MRLSKGTSVRMAIWDYIHYIDTTWEVEPLPVTLCGVSGPWLHFSVSSDGVTCRDCKVRVDSDD